MKKLIPLTLLTFLLLTTAHALFFAGRSVSNYRSIGGIKIDKMGGKTTGIKKINGINFRKKVFDPTEGLVGWWKFDGDATDASGNGNDGTVYGATLTTDREGNSDGAYSFDGVDDYVNIAHDDIFNLSHSGTLSLWVYNEEWLSEYYNLVQKGSPSGGWCTNRQNPFHLFYHHTSQQLAFSICDGITGYDSVGIGNLNIGAWNHYVFTFNGKELASFLDGVLQGKRTQSLDMKIDSNPIRIGGGSSFFNGAIDDVRIYNRALTAEEVQLLYEKY